MSEREMLDAELRRAAQARAEAQAARLEAENSAWRAAEEQADLDLVRAERAKAEARLRSLSARRWPVLLAVASAVVLSLLLGLYVGWRQPPDLEAGPVGEGEPLRLRLDSQLHSR